MSLWYARSRSRSVDSGKFRTQRMSGTEKSVGGQHRGWSYRFVSHQAGASVRRESYSVSIVDPYGNRVEYLRGFGSLERAAGAAREWIDALLQKMAPLTATHGAAIGSIPAPPSAAATHEK